MASILSDTLLFSIGICTVAWIVGASFTALVNNENCATICDNIRLAGLIMLIAGLILSCLSSGTVTYMKFKGKA